MLLSCHLGDIWHGYSLFDCYVPHHPPLPLPHLSSSKLSFLMTFPNWNILVLESFPPSSLVQICMGILAVLWIFWGLCWRWVWKPHADISYSSFSGTCLPSSLWSWRCCFPLGETWEGRLRSQGILNMTGSATQCYLMEQAEMSVCITGNKIERENLGCYI